ncbi:hypothetical protein K469DRAFT_695126 [Zopfia rhizophila CBS 207.26]|uniref:Uncharacterized protein n=1 Tax=Zopfia rhizophila CBS 207.26 TaxID=1314779 RepID=A0A6A6DK07_9PEZI|nr:hypothetical protein K469DRAFT_695126 [Zopfia rhizophila CBS 207.26]
MQNLLPLTAHHAEKRQHTKMWNRALALHQVLHLLKLKYPSEHFDLASLTPLKLRKRRVQASKKVAGGSVLWRGLPLPCLRRLNHLTWKMAGAIAVGASVIGIIQISDGIIHLCKFYIGTAQDAPSDLRTILIEISTLKTILENLQFLNDNGVSTAVDSLASQDGPIGGRWRSIAELENLIPSDHVQNEEANRSKKRKTKATLIALAWSLKEKKARKLLEEIARY